MYTLSLKPNDGEKFITHNWSNFGGDYIVESENPKIVSVRKADGGAYIKCVGNGTTIVTFHTNSNASLITKYNVDCRYISVETLAIDKSVELALEEFYSLNAVISPLTATYKEITWESSDETIVTVDSNGTITGIEVGVATITATTKIDKISSSCEVTVTYKDEEEQPTEWYANGEEYITLYKTYENNFNHNGELILDKHCISGHVVEELNNDFSFELNLLTNERTKNIFERMLLKIPTGNGTQLFRISEVKEDLSNISLIGKHVFYDLKNKICVEHRIESDVEDLRIDGQAWMKIFNRVLPSPFRGYSNITNRLSGLKQMEEESVLSFLTNANNENSFISKYGGELKMDWYNFFINKQRGKLKDYTIEYRKNLTGITIHKKDDVITALYNKKAKAWVYSQYYNSDYPLEKTYDEKCKREDFEEGNVGDIFFKDEIINEMNLQFKGTDRIDLPRTTYNINFLYLENSELYKELRIANNIGVGDFVRVVNNETGIVEDLEIIKTKYNIKTKLYDEIVLGSTFNNMIDVINSNDYKIKLLEKKINN